MSKDSILHRNLEQILDRPEYEQILRSWAERPLAEDAVMRPTLTTQAILSALLPLVEKSITERLKLK